MVSDRDVDQALYNKTRDGNQAEEMITNISAIAIVVVDAWISTAMDEWFRHLQTTLGNLIPQFFHCLRRCQRSMHRSILFRFNWPS